MGFFAGDVGAPPVDLGVTQQKTWLCNQVSAVVNRDVEVPIAFRFGMPFYYLTEFCLEAGAGSTYAPSTGLADGDFLQTGMLFGGAVFD
jgi:hypothetical protein